MGLVPGRTHVQDATTASAPSFTSTPAPSFHATSHFSSRPLVLAPRKVTPALCPC